MPTALFIVISIFFLIGLFYLDMRKDKKEMYN